VRPALRPLRLPAFRRLALVRFVDELGDWLGEIALAVLVYDQTGSPMATAALFLALQFAPALATPPLVARLELLPNRVSLPALSLVQAAAFAGLAMLAADFSLPLVIALAALAGALSTCSRTLTRAAAGAVLSPRGLLREGNASSTSSSRSARRPGRPSRAWWWPQRGPARPCSPTRPPSPP
jgi:hypothetical protein